MLSLKGTGSQSVVSVCVLASARLFIRAAVELCKAAQLYVFILGMRYLNLGVLRRVFRVKVCGICTGQCEVRSGKPGLKFVSDSSLLKLGALGIQKCPHRRHYLFKSTKREKKNESGDGCCYVMSSSQGRR